jgi:hypothetical protein
MTRNFTFHYEHCSTLRGVLKCVDLDRFTLSRYNLAHIAFKRVHPIGCESSKFEQYLFFSSTNLAALRFCNPCDLNELVSFSRKNNS